MANTSKPSAEDNNNIILDAKKSKKKNKTVAAPETPFILNESTISITNNAITPQRLV